MRVYVFQRIRLPHRSTLFPYTTLFRSGMVNITSSVNSRERSGINTILHELNPLFTINVTMVLMRSEERFSRNAETDLVCRLLLEKKKKDTALLGVRAVVAQSFERIDRS